jgi:colicin import membrane protein
MLALSLALHLVLFFLAIRLELFRNDLPVGAKAIYVDVINLPVASPQAGSPSGMEKGPTEAGKPPAPLPLPPPAPPEMKLPKAKPATGKPQAVPQKTAPQETAKEYEARLAALERTAESRHQEAALAEIQNRIAGRSPGKAPAGMPGGTGTQAGSDYAAYIQSRLRDSFAMTIAWQSRKPLVAVRLFIDAKGTLTSYKIEKSTGDVVFEDAVYRAVQLAKKNFPPPPGGKEFSYGFVFKPEGVDKK